MRKPIILGVIVSFACACGSEKPSGSDGASDGGRDAGNEMGPPPPVGGPIPGIEAGAGPDRDGAMPGPALVVTGPAVLDDALAELNGYIALGGLAARQLTLGDLHAWFADGRYFNWSKAERKVMQQHLDAGKLPPGWTLALEQIVFLPEQPWRINLCAAPIDMVGGFFMSCGTVVEGAELYLWVERSRTVCPSPTHDLCDEPFQGPFASAESVPLSPAVQLRVEPIQVAGHPNVPDEYAERDALAVSVNLSATTIPAVVDYFAVGYDRAALEARLRALLGADPSRRVQLQEFLFGWVRERANTFPQGDENDVCHGPARQFYYDVLHNGDYDRSTEAVAVLLTDHYCLVPDEATPRFGDYLYNPGAHSARYIVKDPASGRDVVFSVQSGGTSAYRFYWADEDMSGRPFAHQPMPNYREAVVDTWRRCR